VGLRRCGWCQTVLGNAPTIPAGLETTGICPTCVTRVLSSDRDPLTELKNHEARLATLEGIVREIVRHAVTGDSL